MNRDAGRRAVEVQVAQEEECQPVPLGRDVRQREREVGDVEAEHPVAGEPRERGEVPVETTWGGPISRRSRPSRILTVTSSSFGCSTSGCTSHRLARRARIASSSDCESVAAWPCVEPSEAAAFSVAPVTA